MSFFSPPPMMTSPFSCFTSLAVHISWDPWGRTLISGLLNMSNCCSSHLSYCAHSSLHCLEFFFLDISVDSSCCRTDLQHCSVRHMIQWLLSIQSSLHSFITPLPVYWFVRSNVSPVRNVIKHVLLMDSQPCDTCSGSVSDWLVGLLDTRCGGG